MNYLYNASLIVGACVAAILILSSQVIRSTDDTRARQSIRESELTSAIVIVEGLTTRVLPRPFTHESIGTFCQREYEIVDLQEIVSPLGLELEKLDPDEALVFLVAGIREDSHDGTEHWITLSALCGCPANSSPGLVPHSGDLTDNDRDGWLEYRVPFAKEESYFLGIGGIQRAK